MGRTAVRRLTGPMLGLILTAGCRMPAARVTACRPTLAPRPVLLTVQAVEDTAVLAASHPLLGSRVLLTEPIGYFRVGYAGVAEKRVFTKLMGPQPPVGCDRPTL